MNNQSDFENLIEEASQGVDQICEEYNFSRNTFFTLVGIQYLAFFLLSLKGGH